VGMTKYDRLFHILNLLRSRRNLNAQRLAEECGVTERSIYRDIIALSELNVPIYYDNGYKLASDNFLPPLNFSLDEYRLLKIALDSSPLVATGKYQEVCKSVQAKIEACLSDQVRKDNRFVPRTTHVDLGATVDEDHAADHYSLIEKAITSCRRLKMSYDSIASGLTERLVDPYFIVFKGRAFYFVGWCHRREEFRTFRTDRIVDLALTDETFIRRDDADPETYFDGSWSVFGGDPVEVKVRFTGAAAKVIASGRHHPDEVIEVAADGSASYTVVTRGVEEIQRWILGFGDEAEVIRPQAIRDHLSQVGRYFSDKY